MEISDALSDELRRLTEALETRGADVEASLRRLGDTVARAVDSYLGLSMTLVVDDQPVTVAMTSSSVEVQTSAAVPLTALSPTEPGSVVVFYAGRPGAFVDFAADAVHALGLEPGDVILDRPVPSAERDGPTGLSRARELNQAIGILIEQGHDPNDARTELLRRARVERVTLHAAARALIAAARG